MKYLINLKKEDSNPTINYIRILGFNKNGSKHLKNIKNSIVLPLISNYSSNKDLLELEYKANTIYSLKTNNINKNIKYELNKPIRK